MNPYLEQPGIWHDFHQAYIPVIRNALTSQVVPEYIATIDGVSLGPRSFGVALLIP
jgi:hypothetical protein